MASKSWLFSAEQIIRKPSSQNFISGIGIAFSAGVFASLNLLGAGGGRPDSAHVIQTTNAILSSVWFFSACIGGTYLQVLGPGLTMCSGICTYALYVGSLWYYETSGKQQFPLVSGAIIGIGAGAVFITSGYIQVAYSNDRNKGKFIAIQNTLQAVGSILCSILPVVLSQNNASRAGIPAAVYVTYIVVMLVVAVLSFLTLRRPSEVKDDSSSSEIHFEKRTLGTELKENIGIFRDWKLLILLPSFLPAGSFLIYLGSVNAFQNNLRTRSLLSFVAIVVQIPFGHILHLILDNRRWNKRTRSLAGLVFVGVPLSVAWIWEVIRTVNLNRNTQTQQPIDWTDRAFGPAMILFSLNWTASILWQYLVPWYIGALDIPPEKVGHYMGAQRGFLAAGEAISFGADAAGVPYVAFAGAILACYAAGMAVLAYIGARHILDTNPGIVVDSEQPGGQHIEREDKAAKSEIVGTL